MADPQAGSSSFTSSNSTSTILTTLNDLLNAHLISRSALSLPYLHPYTPRYSQRRKGKSRAALSNAEQLDLLTQLKENVNSARVLLEGAVANSAGGEDLTKLTRMLKEVVNHQTAILPLTSALSSTPAPFASTIPLLPSSAALLPPIELLKHLAAKLGIQTYFEDSQFGLLKTSLTLAGKRFVVDIDLETDAVAGNDEDEDMDGEVPNTATYTKGEGRGEAEAEGKIRLSKIAASHAKGEATVKSDWITKVLKERLERYLSEWNGGKQELERAVGSLEAELRDLRELDEGAGSGGERDQYDDIEVAATTLQEFIEGKRRSKLYPSRQSTLFPSFALLPSSGPEFRLRPINSSNSVPCPIFSVDEIDKPFLSSEWIVEFVPSQFVAAQDGLIVRQTWLHEGDVEDSEARWDGLIRVEHLLSRQSSTLPSVQPGTIPPFPYGVDYVHRSLQKGDNMMEQRWALAEPGPEGFVVGQMKLPAKIRSFVRLIEILRKQAVLDELFRSAFAPKFYTNMDATAAEEDEEEDIELEDLLDAPSVLPISATLQQRSIRLSMPLPHHENDSSDPPTLTLVFKPSSTPPTYVDVAWECTAEELSERIADAVEAGKVGGVTMVEIVKRVEAALRV